MLTKDQGEYQITEEGVSLLDRINQVNVQLYGYDIWYDKAIGCWEMTMIN